MDTEKLRMHSEMKDGESLMKMEDIKAIVQRITKAKMALGTFRKSYIKKVQSKMLVRPDHKNKTSTKKNSYAAAADGFHQSRFQEGGANNNKRRVSGLGDKSSGAEKEKKARKNYPLINYEHANKPHCIFARHRSPPTTLVKNAANTSSG